MMERADHVDVYYKDNIFIVEHYRDGVVARIGPGMVNRIKHLAGSNRYMHFADQDGNEFRVMNYEGEVDLHPIRQNKMEVYWFPATALETPDEGAGINTEHANQ